MPARRRWVPGGLFLAALLAPWGQARARETDRLDDIRLQIEGGNLKQASDDLGRLVGQSPGNARARAWLALALGLADDAPGLDGQARTLDKTSSGHGQLLRHQRHK